MQKHQSQEGIERKARERERELGVWILGYLKALTGIYTGSMRRADALS